VACVQFLGQRKSEVTWLLRLRAAVSHVFAARLLATSRPMVAELFVLLDPRRSNISSASSARGRPQPLLVVRFERASSRGSGCASKYVSTREFKALFFSLVERTGLPVAALETLVLLLDRERPSRRESLRATLTVVLRLGVRDSGVLMELLRECGLPPKRRNWPDSSGQLAQNGQKSQRISHPSSAILPGQELRSPPGTHGRSI
jgi:hypothetical protein